MLPLVPQSHLELCGGYWLVQVSGLGVEMTLRFLLSPSLRRYQQLYFPNGELEDVEWRTDESEQLSRTSLQSTQRNLYSISNKREINTWLY